MADSKLLLLNHFFLLNQIVWTVKYNSEFNYLTRLVHFISVSERDLGVLGAKPSLVSRIGTGPRRQQSISIPLSMEEKPRPQRQQSISIPLSMEGKPRPQRQQSISIPLAMDGKPRPQRQQSLSMFTVEESPPESSFTPPLFVGKSRPQRQGSLSGVVRSRPLRQASMWSQSPHFTMSMRDCRAAPGLQLSTSRRYIYILCIYTVWTLGAFILSVALPPFANRKNYIKKERKRKKKENKMEGKRDETGKRKEEWQKEGKRMYKTLPLIYDSYKNDSLSILNLKIRKIPGIQFLVWSFLLIYLSLPLIVSKRIENLYHWFWYSPTGSDTE